MSACEKCWTDAWLRSQVNGRAQADNYHELLAERLHAPCTPEQQAPLPPTEGEFS